jgi:predicted RNA binding protein YcfA (HicA-like mRNA interferase family)
MKLPVVSGIEAVKAVGKAGYELDEQHGSTSFFDVPSHRIGVSPFRITKNLPKELFGR